MPLRPIDRVVGFIVSILPKIIASLDGSLAPISRVVIDIIILVARDGVGAKTECLRAASSTAIWLK